MSREWEPGDVAMVTYDLFEDGTSIVTEPRVLRCDQKWYGSNGWVANDSSLTIRPLAVIDPEDREQVERLMRLAAHNPHVGITSMQAALREFADPKPPKPEEPQLFAAAVIDSKGRHWTRAYSPGCGDGSKGRWFCGDLREHYTNIDAVRILSDGVVM